MDHSGTKQNIGKTEKEVAEKTEDVVFVELKEGVGAQGARWPWFLLGMYTPHY